MNESQFIEALQAEGFELSEKQLAQFKRYFEMLVEWNEKMNLTAITDQEEVYLKHFYDSLSAAFHFDFTTVETVCDVGAGAGFPSLPLKILYPHLHVTIIDSLNKRITFLNELALAKLLKPLSMALQVVCMPRCKLTHIMAAPLLPVLTSTLNVYSI